MKNLRVLFASAVLCMVLAAPCLAGEIETPGAPVPPPPPACAPGNSDTVSPWDSLAIELLCSLF